MPGVIYGLREIGSDEIRYVGRSIITADHRLRKHFVTARQGARLHVSNWIRSVDYRVETVVLEDNPSDPSAAEIYWIAEMKRRGHRLTNLSDGGDGGGLGNRGRTGQQLTAQHKARIGAANKGRQNSPEAVAKAAATRKANGYRPSPETRAKMSTANSGENNSMHGRRPWCYEQTLSDEIKEKMSEARRQWWARRKEMLISAPEKVRTTPHTEKSLREAVRESRRQSRERKGGDAKWE